MPLYNEETTVDKIVNKVQSVILPENISKEIIIINDCSTDNSQKVIEKLEQKYKNIKIFSHKKNQGKGAAIRTGLKHFTGDFVVMQDCDLEYDPNDFKKMIQLIKNSELDNQK